NAGWIAELAKTRIARVKEVIDARKELDMLAEFVAGVEIDQRIARQLCILVGLIAAMKLRAGIGQRRADDPGIGEMIVGACHDAVLGNAGQTIARPDLDIARGIGGGIAWRG